MKISHKARNGRHRKHPVPHGDHRRKPSYSRMARILRARVALSLAPKTSDWDDLFLRPLASGVHVSPARRTMLGALGFTSTYKDGPEVKSGPSHPRGTGVLREYPQE